MHRIASLAGLAALTLTAALAAQSGPKAPSSELGSISGRVRWRRCACSAADWRDPVVLEALRPYTTRVTLRERDSESVDLQVALLPGWVPPLVGRTALVAAWLVVVPQPRR
jgi:hypothetical protein